MMRGYKCSTQESGFTLLELLIVITILGLILVALTSGVRFAGQAWEAQTSRMERQGDVDAVQNVLRQLITSGKNVTGTPLSLKFVGTLPAALARGGLYDIELRSSNGRLVLLWQTHLKDLTGNRQQSVTELSSGVTNLALAYYVPGSGWLRDSGNTPALIRIAVEQDGGRVWPPLVIAPAVDDERTAAK